MDRRFSPNEPDAERSVAVHFYPVGTDFSAVRDGAATGATDLAPFASRIEQRPNELTLNLAWHNELYGTAEPRGGQLIAAELNGVLLWLGVVEAVSDYRVQSGTRTMSLTARSRDALPKWRTARRTTGIYPMGTALDTVIRDVATTLGVAAEDYAIDPITLTVAQSNLQLGDMTAWEMLESLLLPAGLTPYVDGLGRLKARDRTIAGRTADMTLDEARIVSVSGSRGRSPISAVRLKWLDPNLTEVAQAGRVLASANITAGYFQIRQRQAVYWSDDRSQRARGTYLVIKQSANSGLLRVCSEDYEVDSHTGGSIVLETAAWVPVLLASFLALKAAAALPDIAPPFGGPTAPTGKIVHGGLELTVLLTMASIGTGSYEVWGEPYDYVHARNTTEAYDPNAPIWAEDIAEVTSDLILNPGHAQTVAARELIYAVRSAQSYTLTMVDDPRIEPGDLIGMPDGSKIYVTGYRRQLGRDSAATVDIEGFPV